MEISRELIEKISKLARLKIENLDEFSEEFLKIINYFKKLDEFENIENYEPLSNPIKNNLTLREDVIGENLSREDVLKGSQTIKDDHFEVPKIIK